MRDSNVELPVAPHPPREGRWGPPAAIAAVALVTGALAFGWTLGGYFQGDDFAYVGRFLEMPLRSWPRLFVESWAGDMWGFPVRELRPVTALSFMADVRLWGGNATGFRVTNLLLHIACSALVGVLAWRATGRHLLCGIAGAVMFVLHPIHTEPVQWITGRVDVLATLFYLGGFCAFLAYRAAARPPWLGVFALLYGLAAFSKEFGLTLPLMCLLADVIWRPSERRVRDWQSWAPYVAALAVVTAYYFCRRAAFGPGGASAGVPDLTGMAFYEQLARRQLIYFGYLFPPLEEWWHVGAPVLEKYALRSLAGAAGAIAVGLALWNWRARWIPSRERRAAMFFAFGWYLLATLPLVVTYISGRHLYLASAGVCVALVVFLRGFFRARLAIGIASLVVAAALSHRLAQTSRPWHEAAQLSGAISAELRRLEPELKPGGALFLDVPEMRREVFVWVWAMPFAVRPPFMSKRWDESLTVLESREQYVDWDRWHNQPAIAALARIQGPAWVVQASATQAPRSIAVPPARIRPSMERFAAMPLKESASESWRKLMNELTAP